MPPKKYLDRIITIYAPSPRLKRELEEKAQMAGLPLTRYILDRLRDDDRPQEATRGLKNNPGDVQALREENARLREQGKLQAALIERYESELRSLVWQDPTRQGIRPANKNLIALLKERSHTEDEILQSLCARSQDEIKAISSQLVLLESFGLIKKSSMGWRWRE